MAGVDDEDDKKLLRRLSPQGRQRVQEIRSLHARPGLPRLKVRQALLAMGGGGGGTAAFTPAAIPGLVTAVFWDSGASQDSAGTSPVTGGGQNWLLWKDQYGPGNHLNLAVGTPTAKLLSDGKLGLHTTNTAYLQRAHWLGGPTSQPVTRLCVYEMETAVAQAAYVFDSAQANPNRVSAFYNTGDSGLDIYGGTTNLLGVQANFPEARNCLVAVFNGAASAAYRDGWVAATALAVGSGTPDGVTLGNFSGGANGGTLNILAFLEFAGDATAHSLWPTLLKFVAARCGSGYSGRVYSGGLGYNAWPTQLVSTSGKRICAFIDGTSHTSADSTLQQTTSPDGETWTAPTPTFAPPVTHIGGTSLCQLATSRILQFWATSVGSIGSHVRYSDDDGGSWAALGDMAVPAGYTWLFQYGRPWEATPGGTVFAPGYALNTAVGHTDAVLMQSADHGVTWTLKGVIAAGSAAGPLDFSETAVVSTGGSNLLAVIREDNGANLDQATSADGGATWTAPVLLFHGVSPDLFTLRSGKILLTSCNRNSQVPQVEARATANGGTSWSASPYVAWARNRAITGTSTADFGYPWAAQGADGTVEVLYYGCQASGSPQPNILWTKFQESSLL